MARGKRHVSEAGGGQGRGRLERWWRSLLVGAAVIQRVNHEDQIWPGRYHGVAWLHHLKAQVVESLDDGHWGGNRKHSSVRQKKKKRMWLAGF